MSPKADEWWARIWTHVPALPTNTDPGPRSRHAGKILVVDDEPDVLESTAMLIESLGYEAVRLSDPGKILETIEAEHPVLLLQDLRMSDLNLAGLVATLRSNPDTTELPLVFFSASKDLPSTAARYDAWGYLSKPFSREELARMLERVLGEKDETVLNGRTIQKDVRTLFHDYWNLLAALSNYTEILKEAEGLGRDERRSVRGIDETLLKLEAKTDRLRSYMLSIIESLEAVPGEEVAPTRRRK